MKSKFEVIMFHDEDKEMLDIMSVAASCWLPAFEWKVRKAGNNNWDLLAQSEQKMSKVLYQNHKSWLLGFSICWRHVVKPRVPEANLKSLLADR